MKFVTTTSIWEWTREGGRYKLQKSCIKEGKTSEIPKGSVFLGETMVFTNKCTLYIKDTKIVQTAPITRFYDSQ